MKTGIVTLFTLLWLSMVSTALANQDGMPRLIGRIETTDPFGRLLSRREDIKDGVDPRRGKVALEVVLVQGRVQYTIWLIHWADKKTKKERCGDDREFRVYHRFIWMKGENTPEHPDPTTGMFAICERSGKVIEFLPIGATNYTAGYHPPGKSTMSAPEAEAHIVKHMNEIWTAYASQE